MTDKTQAQREQHLDEMTPDEYEELMHKLLTEFPDEVELIEDMLYPY